MKYPVLDLKATGARIKELRKKNEMTVETITNYMGFTSQQAVYKWERGINLPSVDNLYALSKLFNVGVDDILREETEKDESPSFHLQIIEL